MARSLSYWEKRKAREAYEMYEEVERAALELNKIYASVSDQIERDARRIFRRFETKFGLSEREAEKLLNTVLDPKDIKTVTGLLRRDPKNKELVAQLESQAYASRINRLAKMQDRVDEISTQILGKAEPAFDATLSEVARGSYYREIFGMQQRANAAFAFSPLTVDRISKVLAANWSGKSYSKRLWDNTEALSASVKRELMKGLLMGKSPYRMSQTIEEEFHKGATASRRLMRTEATYVANQMAMEAYKEAGTEKYIYVAILDMRTSEICQSLDKKRFLISSAEVGENYPPMHPWCRSTTIAWMPDEMLKALKQSAIDPATGERIEVPGDMSYETWYNEYVAGKEEEIERREAEGGRNYTSEQFERYRAVLGDEAPKTISDFLALKESPNEWEELKGYYRYKKKHPQSNKEYYIIDKELKNKGLGYLGDAIKPVQRQAYILPKPKGRRKMHIYERMLERHITDDEVRAFQENALCMFEQRGKRLAYYGDKGACVIYQSDTDSEWRYLTAWGKEDFDYDTDEVMEVIHKYAKQI